MLFYKGIQMFYINLISTKPQIKINKYKYFILECCILLLKNYYYSYYYYYMEIIVAQNGEVHLVQPKLRICKSEYNF